MDNPIVFVTLLFLEIVALLVMITICVLYPSVYAWVTLVYVIVSIWFLCYTKWYWR